MKQSCDVCGKQIITKEHPPRGFPRNPCAKIMIETFRILDFKTYIGEIQKKKELEYVDECTTLAINSLRK